MPFASDPEGSGKTHGAADVQLILTKFPNKWAKSKEEKQQSVAQFASDMGGATNSPAKLDMPMVSGMLFGNVIDVESGSYRTLINWLCAAALFADYDGEDSAWLAFALTTLKALNVTFIIITSPSYQPEAPRYRLVIPLCEFVYTMAEYQNLMGRLDVLLHATLAHESYTTLAYFHGNVQGQPAPAVHVHYGRYFDFVTDHLADRADETMREKLSRRSRDGADVSPAELEAVAAVVLTWEIETEVVKRKARRARFARNKFKHFTIRDIAYSLGGVLRKLPHYTPEIIAEIILAELREAPPPPMTSEDAARDTILRNLKKGAAAPLLIGPYLEALNLGPPFPNKKRPAETDFYDPWDPGYPLPVFPEGVLAPGFEQTIRLLAQHHGVNVEALIMATLAAVSAAADKRSRFFPYTAISIGNQIDPLAAFSSHHWWQPPILWVLVIMLSGDRKSGIKNLAYRVLQNIRRQLGQAYRSAMAQYKRLPKAEQNKQQAPEPPPPMLLDHASAEGCDEQLGLTERGLAIALDEASVWLSFGRFSQGRGGEAAAAERGTWNGYFEAIETQTAKVSRKSFAACNGVSVFAMIQQEVLRLFRRGGEEDGLLQRLLSVEAKKAQRGDLTVKVPQDGLEALEGAIRYLWTLGPASYVTTPDGARIIQRMEHYAERLRDTVRATAGFKAACGKFHGQVARLAFCLHLMEQPHQPILSTGTVARADRLMRLYMIPQLLRFFEDVSNQPTEQSLELAGFILKQAEKGDVITQRQIKRSVKGMRRATTQDLNDLMDQAITWGWVTPDSAYRLANTKWYVVVGLLEHFDARRKQEEIDRAASDKLLAQARRGWDPETDE